jgi:3-hydroxyisobutyrate dehydrogenase
LDAIGSRTIWLGEAGSGSRLKLATNAFVLSLTSAVAQSMAVARGLGLEPQQFLEAVSGGPLESPYVKVKGAAMSSRTYDPAFGIEGGIKDADLILAACADSGVDPALLSVVRDQLVRTVEAGHAGEDIAAVYESYGNPGGA